jgi:hypothetical protein
MSSTMTRKLPPGFAGQAGAVPPILSRFALPGAIIGFLVYLVSEIGTQAEFSDPLQAGLMTALIFGGAAFFLTVSSGETRRSALMATAAGLLLGLLAALAARGEGASATDTVLPILLVLSMAFVLLPFIRARIARGPLFDYRPLYAHAWTIPALLGIAQLFVVIGWLLALLVAALFNFIGLPFLKEAIKEAAFLLPYFGLLEAVAIGVVRERESAVLAARSILLALVKITAPVFALCAGIFVVAVMFKGFGSLAPGLSPVATLATSAAAAITMINAIIADDGRPREKLFAGVSRALGFLVVFLMALAIYGLYLRIEAEGLTPNRIIAAFAIGHLALYVPLYAAGALAEAWGLVRRGNIVLSLIFLLTAGFMLSPLFAPQSWSVASQLPRMEEAPEDVSLLDLAYLRDRLGSRGREAFDTLLLADGPLGEKARELGERPDWSVAEGAAAPGEVTSLPVDWAPPPGLQTAILELTVGGDDVVLWRVSDTESWALAITGYRLELHWLVKDGETWRQAGSTFLEVYGDERDAVIAAAKAGEWESEVRTYELPIIGGRPLVPEGLEDIPYESGNAPLGPRPEEAN